MRRRLQNRMQVPTGPSLRFTPSAWAKLRFLRDRGPTEVGGFGLSSRDDLLLVRDVVLPRQTGSPVTVAFDDEGVADYFEAQLEKGLTLFE